jgi:multiple sugar transport system permease protein
MMLEAKANVLPATSSGRMVRSGPGAAAGAAVVVIMAAYALMPLIWVILATTKSAHQLFTVNTFGLPQSLHFIQNLLGLTRYGGGEFWRWMVNSAIYSSAVSVGSTLLSGMVGYVLAKYAFPGKRVLFWAVLSALMVPQSVLVIPIFIVESTLHLVDTYYGLILALLVNPFGVYFTSVYIADSVPTEIIEAAEVDGSSDIRTFFAIVTRMITPGLVTLLLISFVGTWNNFFLPLALLSNSHLFPVTVGLNLMLSLLGGNISDGGGPGLYPLIVMGAFLSVLPMLVLFPVLRKYIASGLTLGSVKG